MTNDFDIDYKELVIKNSFSSADVASGKVNYGLADLKADLYQRLKDHIIPQGADEIFIHMIGEALLFMYYLNSCLGDNLDKVLKILMNKKVYTSSIGKVELKKMFRETINNYELYQAILVNKMFNCEDMRMSERQINAVINGYAQKEIINTFLTKEEIAKISNQNNSEVASNG